jgi:putative glycosyltransferase
MKISAVATLYKTEGYIHSFYQRMTASILKITNDYEIVFINDGSPDNSVSVIKKLIELDSKVKLVDLSRNFGHHQAMLAGMDYAIGEFVFLIDSDLEEEPEMIIPFYEKMMSDEDIDVVYGVQETRKGKFFERLSGAVFYSVFNYLSAIEIPRNLTSLRLMKKSYVESLRLYHERELVLAGIWSLAGFKQVPMVVKKGFRGNTTYSLLRKIDVMTNAIISFSAFPLVIIFRLGALITVAALIGVFYVFYEYISANRSISGWRSLIVSIWFFGGITLMCLGVIGRYVAKIFTEVKQRPRVVVKQVLQGK